MKKYISHFFERLFAHMDSQMEKASKEVTPVNDALAESQGVYAIFGLFTAVGWLVLSVSMWYSNWLQVVFSLIAFLGSAVVALNASVYKSSDSWRMFYSSAHLYFVSFIFHLVITTTKYPTVLWQMYGFELVLLIFAFYYRFRIFRFVLGLWKRREAVLEERKARKAAELAEAQRLAQEASANKGEVSVSQ